MEGQLDTQNDDKYLTQMDNDASTMRGTKEIQNVSENSESAKYEDDSIPSELGQEFLQPNEDDEKFIDDNNLDINFVGMYVEVPVPTQSDFFVHCGDMKTFEQCSGYKKRMTKLEKMELEAKAQRQHEENLIQLEKDKINAQLEAEREQKRREKLDKRNERRRLNIARFLELSKKFTDGKTLTPEELEFYQKNLKAKNNNAKNRDKKPKFKRKARPSTQARVNLSREFFEEQRQERFEIFAADSQSFEKKSKEEIDSMNPVLRYLYLRKAEKISLSMITPEYQEFLRDKEVMVQVNNYKQWRKRTFYRNFPILTDEEKAQLNSTKTGSKKKTSNRFSEIKKKLDNHDCISKDELEWFLQEKTNRKLFVNKIRALKNLKGSSIKPLEVDPNRRRTKKGPYENGGDTNGKKKKTIKTKPVQFMKFKKLS